MTSDPRPRERLPNRRNAEIREFEIGGHKFTATVGRFPDGRPAEIFITAAKTGSAMERSTRDAAILASLGPQHGIGLETLRRALTRNASGQADSALCHVLDCTAQEQEGSS